VQQTLVVDYLSLNNNNNNNDNAAAAGAAARQYVTHVKTPAQLS